MKRILSARITWASRLFTEIDSASLVLFRIAFGAIMLWETTRYFSHDWIRRYWIEPVFLFGFEGFEWLRPWAGNGMYVHFFVLGFLAFCIMIGLAYRLATVLFFLGFTYIFLLDKTHYLNHFYLISILSGLLMLMPANRRFAADAYLGWSRASDTVPAWTVWLLQAQLGLVYFFGGIAKLNPDWLRGVPIDRWLAQATDFPLIGGYFTEPWAGLVFAYGGLLLDLLAAPLLFWRRSRPYMFAALVVFHLMNARLFVIGIFPWFMIAATTIFFAPDWCRGLIPRWPRAQLPAPAPRWRRLTVAFLATFLLIQLSLPWRHFLYPGSVHWTEEGHRFAWHMKLRSKSGKVRFRVVEPVSGQRWDIDPQDVLTKRQYQKMAGRPDMILQFSHYLQRYFAHEGYPGVAVYAESYASLNGRKPYRQLIDPTVDLASVKASLRPSTWIVPLDQGLTEAEYTRRLASD